MIYFSLVNFGEKKKETWVCFLIERTELQVVHIKIEEFKS